MKRVPDINIFKSLLPTTNPLHKIAPSTSTQTQSSACSRASNALTTYNPLKIAEAAQSLFGKYLASYNDVVTEILLDYQLTDILNLRLVSLGCYQLVSTIDSSTNILSLLAYKVAIPFKHYQMESLTVLNQQEKFEFAKNNTQVDVKISPDDLIEASNDPLSILHSIPSNRMKITLILWELDELCALSTSFKQSNAQFLNKIIGLDLSNINIDLETIEPVNEFLIAIADNLKLLLNLTALSFGFIIDGVTFTLPNQFNFLSSLKFKDICQDATLTLPDQLNSLMFFKCGSLLEGATLMLPKKLNSLISFTCRSIEEDFILPEELNSLKIFKCGIIFYTITFPKTLNELISLNIHNFDDDRMTLPKSLRNITELSLERIHGDLNLPESFKNITKLSIDGIDADVYLNIPQSITTLNIFNIRDNVTINLPEACYDQIGSLLGRGNNVTFILPTGTFSHRRQF